MNFQIIPERKNLSNLCNFRHLRGAILRSGRDYLGTFSEEIPASLQVVVGTSTSSRFGFDNV